MMELRMCGSVWCLVGLVILVMYILLAALTVLNLLIGVLCEVVCSVSANEMSDGIIKVLQETVLSELRRHDEDGSKTVNQSELLAVMQDKESRAILEGLEIDTDHIHDVQEMLFSRQDDIPIESIMELMVSSRRHLPATFQQVTEALALTRWFLIRNFQKVAKDVCEQFEQTLALCMKQNNELSATPILEDNIVRPPICETSL
eukprot:NODE_2174_length_2276_cov_6.650535.p1 GENE.NODE_2174_length_2276_cov_6.650535~~NODE_2174_length_2276_cov_6.650535.p1  ORF type:complete len:227 (+),score=61.00 NODE_2174_length_2276_cov_6.650535:74-682(+)